MEVIATTTATKINDKEHSSYFADPKYFNMAYYSVDYFSKPYKIGMYERGV